MQTLSTYYSIKTILFSVLLFVPLIIYGQVTNSNRDTSIYISGTRIDIIFPENTTKACILVLPGWNFPQDDICKKSDFCSIAKKLGYALVMPDMQKSVYHSQIFPETRADWIKYHTIKWLTDSVLPFIEKQFSILEKGQKNFIFGISTGGRGVALLAEKTGTYFTAGAALSGDYDQTLMLSDKLMQGYFGTFEEFPERWKGVDNARNNAGKVNIPLLLAHGSLDKVVPSQQSAVFFEKLKQENHLLQHQLIISPNNGHDYAFWSSQYLAVFGFFESFLQ